MYYGSCLSWLTGPRKLNLLLIFFRPINKGIVQGSGIGPTLYIVIKSDLKALSAINILFKYADDTNLLVSEKTDVHL